MAKTVGYSGSNWYGWYATGQAGHNDLIQVTSGNTLTMPETGYINAFSLYASGANGYTPSAQLYLILNQSLAAYYNFTLAGGSESLGGQHWNTISGYNILASAGDQVEIGLWTAPSAWRAWSYAIASGYIWESDVMSSAPSAGGGRSGSSVYSNETLGAYFTYTPAAPIISSYSETQGHVGTTFTISGYAFQAVSGVKINGVACSFTINSDSLLTVTIAASATEGAVTITNPYGTTTGATFTPLAAPTVSSFSPTTGGPGTVITVNGQYFTSVTGATVGGVACSFSITSDTQMTVTVASGAPTGSLIITDPYGSVTAGTFTSNSSAPTITSVTPTYGFSGTVLNVSGKSFTGLTAAKIGGVTCSFSVVNDSTSTVTIAPGAMRGSLALTNGAGSTTGPTIVVPQAIVYNGSVTGGAEVFVANASSNGWSAWYQVNVFVANASTFVEIS